MNEKPEDERERRIRELPGARFQWLYLAALGSALVCVGILFGVLAVVKDRSDLVGLLILFLVPGAVLLGLVWRWRRFFRGPE